MNSTLLQGTIATQPRLAQIQDGSKSYATFAISFPGPKPEDDAQTMNAIAWGALAETVATYSTGLEVVLEGRVEIRKGQPQGEGYSDPVVQLVASRCHLVSATTPMPAQQSAPAQTQVAPAPAATAKAKTQAAPARTPVTPVAAMAGGGKAEVAAMDPGLIAPAGYEPNYDDIPF